MNPTIWNTREDAHLFIWESPNVLISCLHRCSGETSVLQHSLFCFLWADRDFEPPCEEEDDEETIEVEEQQEGNDAESHRKEIELLKEEGMLPLDQLLSTLNLPQV